MQGKVSLPPILISPHQLLSSGTTIIYNFLCIFPEIFAYTRIYTYEYSLDIYVCAYIYTIYIMYVLVVFALKTPTNGTI